MGRGNSRLIHIGGLMKITVGVPSRGRSLEMATSVISLDKTKSGGHEVQYIVAADNDDHETLHTLDRLKKIIPIRESVGERPLGLGEIHNRLEAEADKDSAFLLWSDRVVPICEHWDHAIAMGVMQFPLRVLWMDSIHLIGAGQFILTPKWREAMRPGKPCPGYFPFWFEDSWVEEVDAFVHGHPRVATYAKCAGPRTDKTNRMRDLPFWIDFYAKCRGDRLTEAEHIAENLGVVPRDNRDLVAFYEARDKEFMSRSDILTEQYSAGGEPDVSYLRAKKRAEERMTEVEWHGDIPELTEEYFKRAAIYDGEISVRPSHD